MLSYMSASGQIKKYKWFDELCTYESTYNSKKLSVKEIENCHALLFGRYTNYSKSPMVFKPNDIGEIQTIEITEDYKQLKWTIETLKLPNSIIWHKVRDSALIEVEQLHIFYTIVNDAFITKDFTVLDRFWATDPDLEFYKNALQGDDNLLMNGWEIFKKKQMQNNGGPERLWNEFLTQKNNTDWRTYAQIDLLTFGWWNAANNHIARLNTYNPYEDFKKLFIKTTALECDEP